MIKGEKKNYETAFATQILSAERRSFAGVETSLSEDMTRTQRFKGKGPFIPARFVWAKESFRQRSGPRGF